MHLYVHSRLRFAPQQVNELQVEIVLQQERISKMEQFTFLSQLSATLSFCEKKIENCYQTSDTFPYLLQC